MRTSEREFITVFNEHYPYERYMLRSRKAITYLFDDVILTEVFVPKIEVKDNHYLINPEDIYVKVEVKGVEARLCLFDFSEATIEGILGIFYEDFGGYEWQSLYVEYENPEDYEDLSSLLEEQKRLITEKYGECKVKEGFYMETVLGIVNGKN